MPVVITTSTNHNLIFDCKNLGSLAEQHYHRALLITYEVYSRFIVRRKPVNLGKNLVALVHVLLPVSTLLTQRLRPSNFNFPSKTSPCRSLLKRRRHSSLLGPSILSCPLKLFTQHSKIERPYSAGPCIVHHYIPASQELARCFNQPAALLTIRLFPCIRTRIVDYRHPATLSLCLQLPTRP